MAEAGSQIIKGFYLFLKFWDNILRLGCHLMLNRFYHAHHYCKNRNFEIKKNVSSQPKKKLKLKFVILQTIF
jgi:hypothetical protein